MKFHRNRFYKHEDGMDAFIKVHYVVFDNGEKATLRANWCVQGVQDWWYCPLPKDRLNINSQNYYKWHPHQPHCSQTDRVKDL